MISPTKEVKQTVIEVAERFAAVADDRRTIGEAGQNASLNPSVMMSQGIARLPQNNLNAILQTMLSIYCAQYLTAIQMQNMLGGVSVDRLLAPLADNQSFRNTGAVAADIVKQNMTAPISWTKESGSLLADYSTEALVEAEITKPTNLAVGKVLTVVLRNGSESLNVNVQVRLNPRVMNKDQLIQVLMAFVGRDNTMIGRWVRYNAGEIKSIWDYLFCLDMLEEDRRLTMSDTDGYYAAAKAAEARGTLAAAVSGKRQVNVASNIFLVTKADAEELEVAMRGKLSNARTRNEFFKYTGGMLLVVVDQLQERISLYQRGVSDYAVFTFDQIEPANTNPNAMDMNAIIKAYKMGDAASF